MHQKCQSAVVMKSVISMSGSGRRAWRKNPCVATATSAAYRPASAPNMPRPSAYTTNASPTPATADGSAEAPGVDHHVAVDDDVGNPRGVPVRVGKRRLVLHRRRIEDHEVRRVPLVYAPAVTEPEPCGRHAGHLVDGRLE